MLHPDSIVILFFSLVHYNISKLFFQYAKIRSFFLHFNVIYKYLKKACKKNKLLR